MIRRMGPLKVVQIALGPGWWMGPMGLGCSTGTCRPNYYLVPYGDVSLCIVPLFDHTRYFDVLNVSRSM